MQERISPSELILNPDSSVYHLGLNPEQLADTIITVGDPERVHQITRHFEKIDHFVKKREFVTHTGTYQGKRLSVISAGMGADNMEILMRELDALVNVDLHLRMVKKKHTKLNIIRLGSSGSLQADIPVGSLLVSDYAIGLDTLMYFYRLTNTDEEHLFSEALHESGEFPLRPYVVRGSQTLLNKIGADMLRGNTLTSPGFFASQVRQVQAALRLPKLLHSLSRFRYQDMRLTNFEMETAGYYALGKILNHEVLSVNAILANRISNEFSPNPEKVIDRLIEKVLDRI